MSFLKKVWGNASSNDEEKPTDQNDLQVAQSMYELDEKVSVPSPKSHDLESIMPTKPPLPQKGGLFSKMKIKKQNNDDKKDLVESVSTIQTRTGEERTKEKLEEMVYRPPEVSKGVFRAEEVQVVKQPEPSRSIFVKKRSEPAEPQNQHQDQDAVPVYIPPSVPVPIKRKNSQNSLIDSEHPVKQTPGKDSISSIGLTSSVTSATRVVRSSSKSSMDNKAKDTKPTRKQSQRIDEVKEIQLDMLRAKERIIESMKRQKVVKNEIMNESESLVLLKERQNEAVQCQNAAVEAEEYEKAAELEEELSQLKEQISTAEQQLEKLEKSFVEAQIKISNEYIREDEEKGIFSRRLVRAKAQAERTYENAMKTETEKIQLQKGKMQRDRKRLGSLENEINFNKEKIQEFEHQYEDDLNNQTKLFKEQKDQLERKRVQIDQEIRHLEKRLEQKREQMLQADGQLEEADSNIEQIKRGSQNEYRKIVQRKDKLYQMEIQRDEFKTSLSHLEVLTEEQSKVLESTLASMRHNIAFISQQSQEYETGQDSFKEKLEKRQRAFERFLDDTKALKDYQKTLNNKHEKLKEIEFKKSSLALQVSLLDGKKKELKDRIPQLETEKIALVSAKNFKGAQLKSSEIKEASDKLLGLSVQVEGCFEQERKLDREYAEAQDLLDAEKSTEDVLKLNHAKRQYELQSLKYHDLLRERLVISKYPSSEKNQLLAFIEGEILILKEQLQFLVSEYGMEPIDEGEQEAHNQQDPPSNALSPMVAEKEPEDHPQESELNYQELNEQEDSPSDQPQPLAREQNSPSDDKAESLSQVKDTNSNNSIHEDEEEESVEVQLVDSSGYQKHDI